MSYFYQIYNYCKTLKTKTGMLIYPYNSSSKPILINPLIDEDIRIYALGLDITKHSGIEIKQSQKIFREQIKDIFTFG